MSKTLYYGEIVAKISCHLHQNPDHTKRINHVIEGENNPEGDTILTVCAEAGRVFDSIEDLSGEVFIDWYKALDRYSQSVLDFLLSGQKPQIIDMVCLAAYSIQATA